MNFPAHPEAAEQGTQDLPAPTECYPRRPQRNWWREEIDKFVGAQVEVNSDLGKYTGVLRAIDFETMNCVLQTETQKILVRNVADIRRERNKRYGNDKPQSFG